MLYFAVLSSFLNALVEEATYEEEHKIYTEHYDMIFSVVHERFVELESTKLKTQKGLSLICIINSPRQSSFKGPSQFDVIG